MVLTSLSGIVRGNGCIGCFMASRIMTGAILTLASNLVLAADIPPVGRYQISVVMGSPGLIMEEVYVSDECLTETDFVEGPGAYVARNPDEDRTCDEGEYAVGEGQLELHIACTFGLTQAAIKSVGTYDDSGFILNADVKLGMAGLALDVEAVLTADYAGECPEGEE
jgi:hypothetical protein